MNSNKNQDAINILIKNISEYKFDQINELVLNAVLQDSNNTDIIYKIALKFVQIEKYDFALKVLNALGLVVKNNVDIYYNLGLLYAVMKDHKNAIINYDLGLLISPDDVELLINKGSSLIEVREYEESLVALSRAIKLNPNIQEAWLNTGIALSNQDLNEEAIKAYDKALQINCKSFDAWINKSKILVKLRQFPEALAACNEALLIEAQHAGALFDNGCVLTDLNEYEKAVTCYEKALTLEPKYIEALTNLGALLGVLRRYEKAELYLNRATNLAPDSSKAWSNLAALQNLQRKYPEAVQSCKKAITIDPSNFNALLTLGEVYAAVKNHNEAVIAYSKAGELCINDKYLLGRCHHQRMLICDWSDYERTTKLLFSGVMEKKRVSEPFGFQGISSSESLLQKCAEIYTQDKFPKLGELASDVKYRHQKIRIGYVSGEFRQQATSILLTRIWELHDKDKFDIYAFDNGWDDQSTYRHRIKHAFKEIIDISRLSASDAAALIKEYEVDILVNLNGFFGLGRQDVFSHKPAPIQVNYLGFPGTIGADYIDYIVADPIVIPPESSQFYHEKVAYLPNSYQANDDQRFISNVALTRQEFGLPECGFVFACFNNSYKITPSTFDSWARILHQVENSVLWLLVDNPTSVHNLRKEISSRGISPNRLIFAERADPAEHLARHRLADLFLDTFIYNAHTTCSDSLWAGLPVLTVIGDSFAGRVGASLLSASGLNELITKSVEEYEALAVNLAKDPNRLYEFKLRLSSNINNKPLFNSALFTRYIESAYVEMVKRYESDLEPENFYVQTDFSILNT